MSRSRSTIVEKLVAGLALAFAFIVMASIFAPADTHAVDESIHHEGDDATSTDPHEGLASLGTITSGQYEVHIYSTSVGPRYTIYSVEDGSELSTLITLEQAAQWYPDLPLDATDFGMPIQLMMAEPEQQI